ncbi:hypothetical protein BGX27_003737, partial [Mortierella sp. AM989]
PTLTSSSFSGATAPPRKRKNSSFETEEPWQSLTRCLIKIINGEVNAIFPQPCPTMPPRHQLLFRHAVESLTEYQKRQLQEKDVILIKDAQVAMSCLVNTMSARVQEYFGKAEPELLTMARAQCEVESIDTHPCTTILTQYVSILEEKGVRHLLKRVASDWGQLSLKHIDDDVVPSNVDLMDRTLQVIILLCNFVLHPPFGKVAPSENDVLTLWIQVFSKLTKKVTLHTGEKAMLASKAMRQMQSAEFGDPSESGRKSDCLFMFEEIELSNIEFKKPGISETDLGVQNRKNIRLGRCLQEAHVAFGAVEPSVLMGDVSGKFRWYVGVFYQIRQTGNIAVAGKATPHLVSLPSTAGGLLEFLSSPSLAIIWNYVRHLEEQGPKLQITKERHEVAISKAKLEQGLARVKPNTPPVITRKFENNVTLSPPKKRSS